MNLERKAAPMSVKPYPSNLIVFDVCDRDFSEDVKLDVTRSWTHIGEVLVRTHATPEGERPRNVVRVKVKFGSRPYLKVDGGESDENWAERMERHILSTMRKVSSNLVAFNRRRRREGLAELPFASMEFELERGALTLEFLLDSNGAVPAACAHMATDVRAALAEGRLGEAVRVTAPSPRAFEAQEEAARAAREAREAEERAHEEERLAAERAAREEAEREAEERFMESPELVEEQEKKDAEEAAAREAAEADDRVSPLEVKPLSREEWDALYGVREAEFEVDYHLWQVVSADGAAREYDSRAQSFVA